jgi:hypothetical protein
MGFVGKPSAVKAQRQIPVRSRGPWSVQCHAKAHRHNPQRGLKMSHPRALHWLRVQFLSNVTFQTVSLKHGAGGSPPLKKNK